mgnify:FL=1
MIEINKELLDSLFVQAESSDRKRINHDLRTSLNDGGQRMLNAMLRSTIVPIHRHPMSNENVILLVGKMDEVFYDDNGIETERIHLDPSKGNYGCVVPQCAWHTVEVLESCVIYEAKDGKYGEDESETLDEYKSKRDFESFEHTGFSNSLGDLKKNIEYLIGMERQSGSMDVISPLYVSRMLNVPLEDVEQVMKEL